MDEELDALRTELRKVIATATEAGTLHQRTSDPELATRIAASVDRGLEQIGVDVLEIPEDEDGAGAGPRETLVAIEEAARRLAAPHLLGMNGFALPAALVAAAGDAEQTQRIVSAVESGERWTAAWPAVTCDAAAITLEGSAVSGRISTAPGADEAGHIVLAVPDADGVVVMLAEPSRREDLTALDLTRGTAALIFDGAPVEVIGRLGTGAAEHLRARWLAAVAAECLGGSGALLDLAVDYASTREAFGRKIGSFQSVRHRCAEMFVQIETLRASVRITGQAIEDRAEHALDEALATVSHAIDTYAAVANTTLLIHGGIGFTYEADVHFHMRRAHSLGALVGSGASLRDELVRRYTVT